MDLLTDVLPRLFELFPQPMFFSRSGIILAANQHAIQKRILPGEPVLPLLAGSEELLRQLPDAPAFEVGLKIGGEDYDASATPMEDGLLFAVRQKTAGTIPDDALVTISNALRNPLSNLFGSAKSMFPRLEELEDPEIQRGMASINRVAYQLLHIACDLTELRGLSAGELQIVREKTELCEFFQALCDTVQPLCQAAGVRLKAVPLTEPCFGSIDRQKVTRAVCNLLSNAVKYTPKGGKVQLSASISSGNLLLRVADSGEGMDSARLSSAFSRYLRPLCLDDPRTGIGFGLPFSRRVAQLHGGNLVLTSTPQKGTTVLLSLPLTAPKTEPPQVSSPIRNLDYSGGFRHELLEFSDVLPIEVFDSVNIN